MIPFCLILGDSTAVGTAQALAAQGIRCEVHARVGAGSAEIERRVRGASAATVALIALGSNDAASPALPTNLLALRRRTTAVKVAWLAPYDLRASSIVTSIAARFGDTVIPLRAQPSRDGIHPVSYRPVAAVGGGRPLQSRRSAGADRARDRAGDEQPTRVVIAIFMPRASVAGTERLDSIPLEQIRPI
jgi:hypothetical protein